MQVVALTGAERKEQTMDTKEIVEIMEREGISAAEVIQRYAQEHGLEFTVDEDLPVQWPDFAGSCL